MLTASIEIINIANRNSFLVRKFQEFMFTAPYHFHPEYELTLILKGSGKRYVGNHLSSYTAGDLVLIGSNLPHCWKTDAEKNEPINAQSIVIQFSPDFLGNDFFSKQELSNISGLLKKSAFGIRFSEKTQQAISQKIVDLHLTENNFSRLIQLLEILNTLATEDYTVLNHRNIIAEQSPRDRERINAVYNYIIENFRENVSLNTAAQLANMSPNAFCKYFKKVTRKTFIETVNDYKLNHAVQQIIHSHKSITEIAFESGFGDLSHFNTLFKAMFKQTPSNFRKKFNQQTA